MSKQTIRQLKHRYTFESKYGEGSYDKLLSMIAAHKTLADIGREFDISDQAVSKHLQVILDMPYSVYLRKQGINRPPGIKKGASDE